MSEPSNPEPDPPAPGGLATIDLAAVYDVTITPLKQGGRRDVTVHAATTSSAVEAPDFTGAMRHFFLAMDVEARRYVGDPVATSQALAHIEALLADVRSVRDRLANLTANALATTKIRRLIVEGIIAVEGKSESSRTDWQDGPALRATFAALGLRFMDAPSGEWLDADHVAAWLLEVFNPTWKLTGLRSLGLEPDDYSTIDRDEAGKPVRRAKVHIIDNRVKGKKA